MPITDYSTTPASNTSISGINIAEGCPPGNINDAIRQQMADMAAWRTGGVATLFTGGGIMAGNYTFSGTLTINAAALTTPLPLTSGGTGANSAAGARTALGLGALATLNTINNDNWAGVALSRANGGTGVTAAPANGQILIGNGSGYALATLTAGAGITITNAPGSITIAAVAGGSVSSVDVSGGTTGLTFSGGPITSNGTITMAGTLAIGSGGTGQATATAGFNALAGVTSTNFGRNVLTWADAAGGRSSLGLGTLATLNTVNNGNWSGAQLTVANGGTGATSLSGVLIGNGTSAFTTKANPAGAFVGTTDTQTLSAKTLDAGTINANMALSDTGTIAAASAGFRGIPQISQSSAYTLTLTDAGKQISISSGGVTIPANSSVAFPVGTTIVIYNNSASPQTIALTSDTLRLAGTATTGARTIAQRGLVTLVKIAATEWVASGNVS